MQRQLNIDVHVTGAQRHRQLCEDVRVGLAATHKHTNPAWFYDDEGSHLFDEITRLPEYYPTRTERAILLRHAAAIADATAADTLVEIGSGTSEKTLVLLDAMADAGNLRRVVLFDISEDVLVAAAATLNRRYGVDVHAVVGDFRQHLPLVPAGGTQLWVFLGGTIGNLGPNDRRALLSTIRAQMGTSGHLLLGTDLVKESERLLAAYDDAAGVTAAFNRNVLAVLNRELNATFDPGLFDHRVVWNSEESWIEMRLRAREPHSVHIGDLGMRLELGDGEEIMTEISAKFTPWQIAEELAAVGLSCRGTWRDDAGDFQVTLAQPGASTTGSPQKSRQKVPTARAK
jgi:L-histidine N-alpha-methyltransferase